MKLYLGADHGGFELKEQLKQWLAEQAYEVIDCGAATLEPEDDYPQYSFKVSENVALGPESKGILVCRSGGGMVIAANKVKGIRAVDVRTVSELRHAVEHNHANVISIGADWSTVEEAKEIVTVFLAEEPSSAPRHARRLNQISSYEAERL